MNPAVDRHRNKVGQHITEMGGRKGVNIAGHFVNLYWVPASVFDEQTPHTLPPAPREPI